MLRHRNSKDGREKFEYVASVFGDRMLLRVEATELNKKKFLWDTLSLVEMVEGLVRLDDGADYDLIGGTAEHHGPPAYTENHNHYATAEVRTNIQNIAAEYHRQFPNEAVLQINDMSLPYGGGFDVRGNWERDIVPGGAHQTHRRGCSVDIATDQYRYRNGQLQHRIGVPIRAPRTEPFNIQGNERQVSPRSQLMRHPRFEMICRDNEGVVEIHSQNTSNEHYHIDFLDQN